MKTALFAIYFAIAFGGLVLTGKIESKRLLFISGWLIIPLGAALATRARLLAVCLAAVAMVGWAGIFTRQWYAAPHLIEPWSEVATYAVQSVRRHGDLIVSNSPSFRFYLDYLLMPAEKARVFNVTQWLRATPSPPLTVLFVEGVSQNQNLQTVQLEAKLRSECALLESEHLVPDSGSDLKLRFFPQFREPPFRISISRFRRASRVF